MLKRDRIIHGIELESEENEVRGRIRKQHLPLHLPVFSLPLPLPASPRYHMGSKKKSSPHFPRFRPSGL